MMRAENRDRLGLRVARFMSQWSLDPSTKVGACVLRPDGSIVSTGWNGFARGVQDLPERYLDRDVKYALVVHAEANAIVTARERLDNCFLYVWPFQPCSQCASLAVQAGIKQVVSTQCDAPDRWTSNMNFAKSLLSEASVGLFLHPSSFLPEETTPINPYAMKE